MWIIMTEYSGNKKVNEIAECFPDLSDGDIKELESEAMQLA